MKKMIVYGEIIIAILFFFSFALISAVFQKPDFYSAGDITDTGLHAIILDSNSKKLHEEKEIELNLFGPKDTDKNSAISPNSQGGGSFYVQNVSEYPVQYTMKFTDENYLNIPLSFRLRDQDGNLIVGSETTWVDIQGLQNLTQTVGCGEQVQYFLEWIWNSETDTNDTHIGIDACAPSDYILTINVLARPMGLAKEYTNLAVKTDALSVILAVIITVALAGVTYYMMRENKQDPNQDRSA